MGVSLLNGCTESCGWTAAVICVFAFGSFGVPLKTSVKVEMHPLVMQSYKTSVCFATCWLVILLGEPVRWSYWGIASGLFWVPGATCGIFGIRNAGLAVAVGTWSAITVLTSFFFGFIIFQERVKHFSNTCFAFIFLILGLIGMSRYSAHPTTTTTTIPEQRSNKEGPQLAVSSDRIRASKVHRSSPPGPKPALPLPSAPVRRNSFTESSSSEHMIPTAATSTGIIPLEMEALIAVANNNNNDDEATIMGVGKQDIDVIIKGDRSHKERMVFFGGRISLTRRQMGILGAIINGAWGGLNLVPLHFALVNDGLTGAGYLISYATGALIVNTAIWILLYAYYLYQKRGRWEEALECLPKFHFDHLLWPGIMAGSLYSLGNFTSILAVTYLGQATGYSFCMMQLFVSGLWGVFYFREIKGVETITKWFLSAAIAVSGIIWLSYEHEGGAIGHRRR